MLSKQLMAYKGFLLLFFIALFESSCKKPDEFPDEPVITYKDIYSTRNAQGYDQKMTVLLNFTDGDGDVGYREVGQNGSIYDDPNSQYYNNYVAKLFQFTNGNWTEYPTILPLGGRLPYLTPFGKNKTLKGEISCDVDVPLHAVEDTFRLEIFIYDRALHKSNVATTSEIVLNTQ
jgi:hypothetical protein